MPIPTKYRVGGENLASYSATEILEGTGVQTFNGFCSRSGGSRNYHLTSTTPYSASVGNGTTSLISTSGALTNVGDVLELDFDSGPLNLPRIIKGTAYFNFSWRVTNSSSTSNSFPYVKLIRLDSSGAEAATIGTASGAIQASAIHTACLRIANISPTLIKPGEQIRVSCGVECNTNSNSPVAHIAHDPQNEADDYFTANNFRTTKMNAFIPFRLDL